MEEKQDLPKQTSKWKLAWSTALGVLLGLAGYAALRVAGVPPAAFHVLTILVCLVVMWITNKADRGSWHWVAAWVLMFVALINLLEPIRRPAVIIEDCSLDLPTLGA